MIRKKIVGRNSNIIHDGDKMWCQNVHVHKKYVKHIVSRCYLMISMIHIFNQTNSFQYNDNEASVIIFLSLRDLLKIKLYI